MPPFFCCRFHMRSPCKRQPAYILFVCLAESVNRNERRMKFWEPVLD